MPCRLRENGAISTEGYRREYRRYFIPPLRLPQEITLHIPQKFTPVYIALRAKEVYRLTNTRSLERFAGEQRDRVNR